MKIVEKKDIGKPSGAVYVQLREGLIKRDACGYYGKTTSFTVYDTTLEELTEMLRRSVRKRVSKCRK